MPFSIVYHAPRAIPYALEPAPIGCSCTSDDKALGEVPVQTFVTAGVVFMLAVVGVMALSGSK